MKRLQIYIEESVDDRLGIEAAWRGVSKAAVVRESLAFGGDFAAAGFVEVRPA